MRLCLVGTTAERASALWGNSYVIGKYSVVHLIRILSFPVGMEYSPRAVMVRYAAFALGIPLPPRRPKHFRTSAPSLYHERTGCELMIRLEGESQRLVSIRHGSLQLKLRLLIGGRGGHKGIRLTAPID